MIAASCTYGAVGYAGLLLGIPDGAMALALVVPVMLHVGFVATRSRRVAHGKPLDQTQGNA
jgi:hypothetical protein